MTSIKNRFILNYILIFCMLALSAAYIIQYILGHQPCNLCLIERIPYLMTIIFISLIFILKKYEKLISIIIALLFAFGAAVSIYHVGIEQGIFKESLVCDLVKGEMNNITPSEILKELEKKTVSCKVVSFRFLGFSLATFNTIISFLLSAIMIVNIKNYGKN